MSRRGAGIAFCIFGTLITPGLIQIHELILRSPLGFPIGLLFLAGGALYLLRAEAADIAAGAPSRRGAGVTCCIFGTLITPGLIQGPRPFGFPVGLLFLIVGVIYLLRAEAADARDNGA